jgi:hypothetical protein
LSHFQAKRHATNTVSHIDKENRESRCETTTATAMRTLCMSNRRSILFDAYESAMAHDLLEMLRMQVGLGIPHVLFFQGRPDILQRRLFQVSDMNMGLIDFLMEN